MPLLLGLLAGLVLARLAAAPVHGGLLLPPPGQLAASSSRPSWVSRLFRWVRARRRVKMMVYKQGLQHEGVFELDDFPRSRAEIERQLERLE